ncbi:hypothetical protein D9757_004255 [Collybiopsis confluens]|uniref:Glutamate--cysteine ligase n=1 Tax=Collybiopsis confluens TaxID=2823264 RepID=A0A8H5HUI5_9AGAR|nr:hypothetical protein D9757_004255 [Collybiopsis confluens]
MPVSRSYKLASSSCSRFKRFSFYSTLTANIRSRRGSKVAINLPIFFDEKTPRPFIDPTIPWDRCIYPEDSDAKNGAALTDHIYMDAMGFGMGCCCLQLTYQACNVNDARRLYDGLIPIGPIMVKTVTMTFLALTAGSPIWRGYLSDVDCRWNVVAGSVDDRTEEERGLKDQPLEHDRFRIPKSRYDSVDLYISEDWRNRAEYNDKPIVVDEGICNRLREYGLDDLLSKHIGHLFIRDPLVVFSEMIDQKDEESNDHFENIQSTNWQTLRFKPPPPNSPIGWRVEFRSMEVQMTDFENAAYAVFITLLSRAILSFNLNFYIPISKVDENMARAQARNASRSGHFYFRKEVYSPGNSPKSSGSNSPVDGAKPKSRKLGNCFTPPEIPEDGINRGPVTEEYEEMTIDEIINGKGDSYTGLLGLVWAYIDTLDSEWQVQGFRGFSLLTIGTGTLLTPATWIRNFVRTHPAYARDSVVTQEMNYDLIVAIDEIERGVRAAPDLLPENYTGGEIDRGSLSP